MLEIEKLKFYLFEFLSPIQIISNFSSLLPILFCLRFFPQIKNGINRYLLFYSIAVLAFEIIFFITGAFTINNHNFYLLFYLIEAVLFAKYYSLVLKSKSFNRFLVLMMIIIMALICNNLLLEKNQMDNYGITTISGIFIGISIYTFYEILSRLEIQNLFNSTLFWFNTANLIYFAGRFFTFLFIFEILTPASENQGYLWQIVSVVVIVHRILICFAIYKVGEKK